MKHKDIYTALNRLPDLAVRNMHARQVRMASKLPNDVQAHEQELRDEIEEENKQRLTTHAIFK